MKKRPLIQHIGMIGLAVFLVLLGVVMLLNGDVFRTRSIACLGPFFPVLMIVTGTWMSWLWLKRKI